MAINIRTAVIEDSAELIRLSEELAAVHNSVCNVTTDILSRDVFCTQPRCSVLVADAGGGLLAGFVAGYPSYSFQNGQRISELQNLHVNQSHRQSGIGRLLVEAFCDQAKKEGAECVKLGVMAFNETARAFYKSTGFIERAPDLNSIRCIRSLTVPT